jgi:hypothetical protein
MCPDNPGAPGLRCAQHETRLNNPAIREKNKKIYLLSVQAVSDFYQQKNHEFSHETRIFVLITEGQLYFRL